MPIVTPPINREPTEIDASVPNTISYVTQTMVSSVSSFTMLAVPLFMAVGELMNAR